MDIALILKNHLKYISPLCGAFLNKVPYDRRPGINSIYKARKKQLEFLSSATLQEKIDFAFLRIKSLVDFSYSKIPFYKWHYDKMGYYITRLRSFDDIKNIPIITKSILNEYELEDRSFKKKDRYIVNTGGSSGTPFNFYIESSSMGHEWAHMHHIWNKLGYRSSDLKLTFGGRSNVKKIIDYDVVRNHFAIDLYADYDQVARKLLRIAHKFKIKYLHGYPSSIYDFALYCNNHSELRQVLSRNLKGAFLGSEYPHEQYRQTIEDCFNIPSVSWYGHTERAVLAYEKYEKFTYHPFLSYGFAEALPIEGDIYNLIGTSYYNYASPLIRYNTEDLISHVDNKDGLLESFKITKGREGEFIIDKTGKKINLTALIFGRHHALFNYSKFIQVKQVEQGNIEIHFVGDSINELEANELFDSQNLNCDIRFIKDKEPSRTPSGKINLLIK